jgi:ABC-type Mn2+/Zn2+ transport system permease subunit
VFESLCQVIASFPQAVLAGVLIAVTCSVLGVFVILKRVVFIGITLSEVASLGIALAMVLRLPPLASAGALTLAAVALLAYPFELDRLPREAVMGVVFVLASSLSILLVAGSGFGLHEIKALLYGDLILTSRADLTTMAWVLLPVLAALLLFLRPILHTFLDRQAAKVMGMQVGRWELLYFLGLGLAVSAASRAAGSLLVFCYLVVAPAAALLLSRRLGLVMLWAVGFSLVSTLAGLAGSFRNDWPANQTIALATCLCFGLALLTGGVKILAKRYINLGRRS